MCVCVRVAIVHAHADRIDFVSPKPKYRDFDVGLRLGAVNTRQNSGAVSGRDIVSSAQRTQLN